MTTSRVNDVIRVITDVNDVVKGINVDDVSVAVVATLEDLEGGSVVLQLVVQY